jgi:putative membrane protein
MHKKRNPFQNFILFMIGAFIGIANKTPGVSGGMVLLVSGVYDEYIFALERINKKSFSLIWKGKFKEFYQYINGNFLLWVGLGSIFAFFAISVLLDFFLQTYETQTLAFFFGLIIGSVYYIHRRITHWNKTIYSTILISTLIGLSITFIKPLPENTNFIFIFLCGIVSVFGVPLPGFSGSFLVFIMGNYALLLVDAANNLLFMGASILDSDFSFLSDSYRMNLFLYGIIFSVGSTFGLIFLSKLVGYLLKKYHNMVIASLIGFISGSLGAVWPWRKAIFKLNELGKPIENSNGENIISTYKRFLPTINPDFFLVIGISVVGFFIVYAIAEIEKKYFIKEPKL